MAIASGFRKDQGLYELLFVRNRTSCSSFLYLSSNQMKIIYSTYLNRSLSCYMGFIMFQFFLWYSDWNVLIGGILQHGSHTGQKLNVGHNSTHRHWNNKLICDPCLSNNSLQNHIALHPYTSSKSLMFSWLGFVK